jgi:hypothetical protein
VADDPRELVRRNVLVPFLVLAAALEATFALCVTAGAHRALGPGYSTKCVDGSEYVAMAFGERLPALSSGASTAGSDSGSAERVERPTL